MRYQVKCTLLQRNEKGQAPPLETEPFLIGGKPLGYYCGGWDTGIHETCALYPIITERGREFLVQSKWIEHPVEGVDEYIVPFDRGLEIIMIGHPLRLTSCLTTREQWEYDHRWDEEESEYEEEEKESVQRRK